MKTIKIILKEYEEPIKLCITSDDLKVLLDRRADEIKQVYLANEKRRIDRINKILDTK